MRADTHDGPEQKSAPLRDLIHCCSSHVRRSWKLILHRAAGPYILARSARPGVLAGQNDLSVRSPNASTAVWCYILHGINGSPARVSYARSGSMITDI